MVRTPLTPEERDRGERLGRLLREARSAGVLSHPGIVTIYDVEQQGDLAYIAMEYVDGPTLDQLISQGKPLAPNQIFSILGRTRGDQRNEMHVRAVRGIAGYPAVRLYGLGLHVAVGLSLDDPVGYRGKHLESLRARKLDDEVVEPAVGV